MEEESKQPEPISRRGFIKGTIIAAGGAGLSEETAQAAPPAKKKTGGSPVAVRRANTFQNIQRLPDAVIAFTETGTHPLATNASGAWQGGGIEVITNPQPDGLHITLSAPKAAVKRLLFRWRGKLDDCCLFLGDHWERGYGDLEWRGCVPERAMPWYVLTYDGMRTHGYGVKTVPGALCFWQADGDGLSLWADVRSGGVGVQLGERRLEVCTVVSREGKANESPWKAQQAFCKAMCPNPRLPAQPVYGTNDWYYAYGNNTAEGILEDCYRLVNLASNGGNRPYTVVDAGWQPSGGASGGPWDRGNNRFPSMPELSLRIRELSARPGIWIRPLAGDDRSLPEGWRLGRDKSLLDPTVPDVLHQVATDIARLREWKFELIKHDFSTVDILGKWGFQMGTEPTKDGWQFAHRDKTNAEIILELYQTIRKAADTAIIIGCNTVGHLSAGLFELCRIGDDTSGQNWERTRKMGVNSLAFRGAQHNTFYAADADCVGLTKNVPWEQNRQWLDLLARSGTPLFLSLKPDALGPEQEKAIRAALTLAAEPHPTGEPLDWMQTTCPRKWRLHNEQHEYDWFLPTGATPFNV